MQFLKMSETDVQPKKQASIFAVDDHPVIATGLKIALLRRRGFELAGSATGPEQALSIIRVSKFDVLIIDLVFDGKARTDFITLCRDAAPDAVIVVFSSLPPEDFEETTLSAGADAYVSKERTLDELIDVIARLSCNTPMPPVGAVFRCTKPQPAADGIRFTQRELEIAELLSRGYSMSRIAEAVGISIKTAAVHCDNIRKKLKCKDSRELIALLAKTWSA